MLASTWPQDQKKKKEEEEGIGMGLWGSQSTSAVQIACTHV